MAMSATLLKTAKPSPRKEDWIGAGDENRTRVLSLKGWWSFGVMWRKLAGQMVFLEGGLVHIHVTGTPRALRPRNFLVKVTTNGTGQFRV